MSKPHDRRKISRDSSYDPARMRARAEETLRTLETLDSSTLSVEEARVVLHELRVHQVELQMQNEELREAQAALDVSRARYLDLYELAPVSYCTLSTKGIILRANLTTADLFGTERGAVIRRPLSHFIHAENRNIFYLHLKRLLQSNQRQTCELRMLRKDAEVFWARLESIVGQDEEDGPVCRMVISDITERKIAENALRESERQLRALSAKLLSAEEEERKRIAAELHDSIGSSLSAIKFGIENARSRIERGESKPELLDAPFSWTRLAIDEVRRLMAELRPPVIDELGVIAALQRFFGQFRTTYPEIQVEVEIGIEEQDIPETLRIVIFRIAQEAFHNIAKHSRADSADFSFVRRDGAIKLSIEDNGKGFDCPAALWKTGSERHFGLAGMKERAELSGGSFAITSVPGNGTEVSAQWPLKDSAVAN